MTRCAIYAGSFDPLTNGHVHIIRRGRQIFDRIIVAVAHNISKKPLFDIQERIDIINHEFQDDPGILVETFQGLLVNYAREHNAQAILRGLRGMSDFEYELQMANMNRSLAPEIETVFLMSEGAHSHVSSRLVKEVASLGGKVDGVVPAHVAQKLYARFRSNNPS